MDQLRAEDPQRIGGYRLLGRLGTGGMGRVFLARSDRGRTVAVKLVRAELAAQEEFRTRFRREVLAARRVGGSWTAPVLDADTEAEIPWVATGYVAGPSLQQVVKDYGPLPERSVTVLAAGLAYALVDIHTAGLVHRDLKPSNVMITIDGPRVIDFGIARALETVADGSATLTHTGAMVGSPAFMSPEQVRGDRVTPACDVFCLGSVLAYAVTGLQPFGAAGSGVHAQMFRIVQEPPDLDAVPEGLRGLVAACLVKEPGQRPSLGEVLAMIGGAADEAPQDTPAGRVEPWLPGAIVAQLGRHAVQLLELEAEAEEPPAAPAPAPAAGPAPQPVPPPATYTPPSPPATYTPPSPPGSTPPPPQTPSTHALGAPPQAAGTWTPAQAGHTPAPGTPPQPAPAAGTWTPAQAGLGHTPGTPPQAAGTWGSGDGTARTLAGGPPPARPARRRALVAVLALLAVIAGGTTAYVVVKERGGDSGAHLPSATTGAPAGTSDPATSSHVPTRTPARPLTTTPRAEPSQSGTPTGSATAPADPVTAVAPPQELVGTWQASFSSATGVIDTRRLTVNEDGSVTLAGTGSKDDRTTYSCRWTMSVVALGPPVEVGPSQVVGEPGASCLPGGTTTLTLVDATHLQRELTDRSKDMLTYEKTG